MTEPALEASELDFSYPLQHWFPSLEEPESRFALYDLNVRVPRGSIYGLLGPNGCGKSTLLQLALGLMKPDDGELRVLGLNASSDSLRIRRRVGYVPQKPDLDPEMTVAESLDFVSMFFGDRWNEGVMKQALERFRLSFRLSAKVGTLSTGFQQRLSLVMALAIEPEVLILDEPTAGLDAVVRRNFADAVIDYISSGDRRTVIISSHLLSEIEALVDHVGIMRSASELESALLVEAPLDELKERALVVKTRSTEGFENLECSRYLLSVTGTEPRSAVFWLEEGSRRQQVLEELKAHRGEDLRLGESSLDEIFVALAQQPRVFRRSALPEKLAHV